MSPICSTPTCPALIPHEFFFHFEERTRTPMIWSIPLLSLVINGRTKILRYKFLDLGDQYNESKRGIIKFQDRFLLQLYGSYKANVGLTYYLRDLVLLNSFTVSIRVVSFAWIAVSSKALNSDCVLDWLITRCHP